MTEPSIRENFINEPIPEDKAAAACAAVRKSTALPRSLGPLSRRRGYLSGSLGAGPSSNVVMRAPPRIVFFTHAVAHARDRFLRARRNARSHPRTLVARARVLGAFSPLMRAGKSPKAFGPVMHPSFSFINPLRDRKST